MIQKAKGWNKKDVTQKDIKHQAIIQPQFSRDRLPFIERRGIEVRGIIKKTKKQAILDFQEKKDNKSK